MAITGPRSVAISRGHLEERIALEYKGKEKPQAPPMSLSTPQSRSMVSHTAAFRPRVPGVAHVQPVNCAPNDWISSGLRWRDSPSLPYHKNGAWRGPRLHLSASSTDGLQFRDNPQSSASGQTFFFASALGSEA